MSTYTTDHPRTRRYLVIGATLALAAAGLAVAMSRSDASAATAGEVALHCRDGSPLLERCDFIQRTETTKSGDSFRVSEVQNNCDGTVADPFNLAVSVRSSTETQVETTSFFTLSGSQAFPG